MTNTRAANEALNAENQTLEVQVKPLSDLSDFEINKHVGEITGQAKNVEPKLQVVFRSSGTEFNPCNRPDQAWPIIQANKISLVAPTGLDLREEWIAYPSWDSEECVPDINPLRAGMIAFLMKQGGSDD